MQPTVGKRRNVVLTWLVWPMLTLGIYTLVWWYKINRETRDFDPQIKVKPGVSVLALTLGALIVVPPFLTIVNTGKRIAQAQRTAGLDQTCNPVVGLLLAFVAGLHTLYLQSALNQIWEKTGSSNEAAGSSNEAAAGATQAAGAGQSAS